MCCLVADVLPVGSLPVARRARVDVFAAYLYAGGASVMAAAFSTRRSQLGTSVSILVLLLWTWSRKENGRRDVSNTERNEL